LGFKDHFSRQAGEYTQFRPHYPPELFAYLASLVTPRHLAWDCGTGNGQAAVALTEYFEKVVATDPSASQIEHAQPHDRVEYRVAAAEHCPLADQSVDLVTVAQALHWFHLPQFYAEVRRIVRPDGVLAVWSYGLTSITPAVDAAVWRLYHDLLDPFWPAERKLIEEGYATIEFPFPELPAGRFRMTADWTLDALVGYLRTWSAVQRYMQQHGTDPLLLVESDLRAAWGAEETVRQVTWPLYLRVGRIEAPVR